MANNRIYLDNEEEYSVDTLEGFIGLIKNIAIQVAQTEIAKLSIETYRDMLVTDVVTEDGTVTSYTVSDKAVGDSYTNLPNYSGADILAVGQVVRVYESDGYIPRYIGRVF